METGPQLRPHPVVTRVELVRASAATSLLRVDLDGPGVARALLVVRGVGLPRRLGPLPTPPATDGPARLAFAVPAELLGGRFALQLDDREVALSPPPERTREDAVAAVELQRTRARLAEVERQLESGGDATGDLRRRQLEHQLAEHRLLRAQLSRELQVARERGRSAEEELRAALDEQRRLEQQLAGEQAERAAEHERLEQTLEAARSRVAYLERRLVEVRAQRDLGG